MKQLITLLVLFPCLLTAQSKVVKKTQAQKKNEQTIKEDLTKETVLKDRDFITDTDGVHTNRRTILLNDGSEKPVETQFLFSAPQEKFKTLGLQQINMILKISNYKTILNMKNKYTYQPRKVSLLYDGDKSEWACGVEYTGQNDYGAVKNGTVFYLYNETGIFIESLRGY